MNIRIKPIIKFGAAPLLCCGLMCQVGHAQQVTETGTLTVGGAGISGATTLADVTGHNTESSEILTIDWTVTEPTLGMYDYTYDLYNPAGDVIETVGPQLGQPEDVDQLVIGNAVTVGLTGLSGGALHQAAGSNVKWAFYPVINPGGSSGVLSFDSPNAPSDGNATANDSTAPSPWSSSPNGGYLPVPGNGSFSVPAGGYFAPIQTAPDEASTFMMLAGVFSMLPLSSFIKRQAK